MTKPLGAEVRRPIRDGLLKGDLSDLQSVKLAGSRCKACHETTLGANTLCPNCGSAEIEPLDLSSKGVVWTFTVVRYKPPGDYRGPDPFAPFAMGLVELPEGARILAPIGGDPEAVRIGMSVVFCAYVRPDGVVAFKYEPAG
jgi:uncharacterized OB-fold protein